jgi:hypothetical protein
MIIRSKPFDGPPAIAARINSPSNAMMIKGRVKMIICSPR